MTNQATTADTARADRRAVVALGLTQLIGWGTTYYLPAVLTVGLQRDLGLSTPAIFSSVAIMLITSAVLAPPAGRLMDRLGAGRLMPAGSLLLALSLLVLAMADGFAGYALAWIIAGLGMTLAMSNAAFVAMAQMSGQRARRSIVIVMLFGGMAATVFWPLTLWLEVRVGWRITCLIFAALHVVVCAPLHAIFLAGATSAERRQDLKTDEAPGMIAPDRRVAAAWLIMVAVTGNGLVSWGLDLHLITILQEFGLSATVAVAVAAWKGPATLLARGVEIVAAGRVTALGSVIVAGALIPASLALALVFNGGLMAAVLFITVFSFGTGLMTIARATLPLSLLGAKGYGDIMGRLTLPTQIVSAFSPMFYGLFMERFGLAATLWVSLVAAVVSLLAILALARMAKG